MVPQLHEHAETNLRDMLRPVRDEMSLLIERAAKPEHRLEVVTALLWR